MDFADMTLLMGLKDNGFELAQFDNTQKKVHKRAGTETEVKILPTGVDHRSGDLDHSLSDIQEQPFL